MESNNKFKIILLSVFGLFILVGLLAFATYKSKSSANQNVTVSIWGTISSVTFNNFIQKFSQDNQVQLKVSYVQKDISHIYSDTLEAIASGKAPDAVLIPQELMKSYSDKIYPIPSATVPTRTFEDTFVQESSIYERPDGIFGLPFFVDPLVMYWNKDTFFSAGIANPPKTWAEIPLLAGKLSKSDANANITKSAVSFGEYSNVDNAKALISALIMQTGNPIVLNDNNYLKSTLHEGQNAAGAVSALNFYTEYSNPKKSDYSWNRSLPSSKQEFLSGDLATYFGFASEAKDLRSKNPNLNFDVAIFPQIVDAKNKSTFGELYGFALLKNSPNLSAGFSVISELTGNQAVTSLLSVANVSPARRDIISLGSTDPIKTIFYNSALISKAWIDPDTTKTDAIFKEMIENISSGRETTDSSLQKAGAELDLLLAR